MVRIVWLFLFLFAVSPAWGCEFCDVVAEVVDGDTVIVVNNGAARTVHLVAIDAPQIEQPYGKEAKAFTEELLLNRVVSIDASDPTKAADIVTFDGQSLKWGLIRAGLAWYPENHVKTTALRVDDRLGKYENRARRQRLGLWADANPIPPWTVHRGTETLPSVVARFANKTIGGPCIIG